MSQMTDVCESCGSAISTEFGPGGPRSVVLIDSDMVVSQPCFVHDTIVFKEQGRLIFGPVDGGRYAPRYSVVCRKLVIDGGGDPLVLQPCEPFNPTDGYKKKNVITWRDRVYTKGTSGAPFSGPAATVDSLNTDDWTDLGQGNDGKNGGTNNGATGPVGQPGMAAPSRLTVVALEVEFRHQGSLIVDWHGQNGGNGADGQDGARGGDGMGGRDGHVDESWTGDSCGRQPGNGGKGGDGGTGGPGGAGGVGGRAGSISVVTPTVNLIPGGAFVSGAITLVCGGANGGNGGKGGKGSQQGGVGGKAGKRGGSECGTANPGVGGNGADPGPAADGANGPAGATGTLVYEPVEPPASSTCADVIPIIPVVASVTPGAGFQGTSAAVAIAGTGFDPSATSHGVAVSGTGVSVNGPSVVVGNDTAIAATFDISASAAVGPRDVIVQAGPYQGKLVGGFTVQPPLPPTVGSIVPNSGVAGTPVDVVVTGTQFDTAALIHLVQISGAGVPASVTGVTNTTINATLTIANIAPAGARNVSVTVGGQTSAPLVGGFTVVAPPAPTIVSVAPSSGARNAVVNVTITGTNFDQFNPIHQVNVSGAGVTASVVAATNTTITCTFTIGSLAPQTARDVTVTVGAQTSAPLVGGFTVA